MLEEYGSDEECALELDRLKKEVVNILHTLTMEGRFRPHLSSYPFQVFLGWNRQGRKALVIVIGDWAKYLGLESELSPILTASGYADLTIFYPEERLPELGEELREFMKNRGIIFPPPP
jgi:hypothetical protein